MSKQASGSARDTEALAKAPLRQTAQTCPHCPNSFQIRILSPGPGIGSITSHNVCLLRFCDLKLSILYLAIPEYISERSRLLDLNVRGKQLGLQAVTMQDHLQNTRLSTI